MKFLQEVHVPIVFLLLSVTLASSSSPLVLVKTSVSSSSSSSSSSSAEPLDDSLAVEGRNVKIVRRIRVRTTTTPAPISFSESAPSTRERDSGSDFTEAPEIQEWFALKHKEFERVKGGTGTPLRAPANGRPIPTQPSTSRLLSEAEYVYEFSDTSNGPRVQVIYGDGKTPPPAGLMESPDMIELVREHLHEPNANAGGVEQPPAPAQATESPSSQPPVAAAPQPLPPVQLQLQPLSPQEGLIPPIYHVGGNPVAVSVPISSGPSAAPAPAFLSPYHGQAYTPGTETKTYVSSAPPVFTQPTSVTMPAKHVPGVRTMSAWRWPTYVEEQESNSGAPFSGFEYSFPPFTSNSQRGPPPPQSHSPVPNYYPAELPFTPYEEPVYSKPPVVQTKSRPDGSPNSIPWTPLPPSSPFGVSYQKTKSANSIGDAQATAESSYSNEGRDREMPPGSYSTLGKRMTAPDSRSPASMGQYPDEFPDSVIKESHYVNAISSAPAPEDYNYYTSSSDQLSEGESGSGFPSDEEYSNYIMDSGPSSSQGQGPSYEGPSYYVSAPRPMAMPFPGAEAYNQPQRAPAPPPPLPKTMYMHYSSSSAFPPFLPMPVPQPPPSLPSFYSPSQNPAPNPQKHYKIMLIKPPSPPPESNLVYMLHEAPRSGPASSAPPTASASPTAGGPTSASSPQLYYVTSGSYNYKKRST